MGNVIYCETKETTTPYIFANTRIAAYSYEEVCYYVVQNPSMITMDSFGPTFVEWVREKLEMEELAQKLAIIMEGKYTIFAFLEVLLLAANYYTKAEVLLLFERMKAEEELPKPLRLKKQADGFLQFQKYVRAIRIYDAILEGENKDSTFKATIYHNKGVALSKNFELHSAAQCFKKAYETDANDVSLSCYLTIFFMLKQEDKAKSKAMELGVAKKDYERILSDYQRTSEGYRETPAYEEYKKAMEDKKYGQDGRKERRIQKLMMHWKEDYRTQTD